MKNLFALLVFAIAVAFAPLAPAQLSVAPNDTVETVLTAQKGKRVTLRLRSGHETTGTVAAVSGKLVHLAAVAGKEFFDAVIPVEAIEAVFVRSKN